MKNVLGRILNPKRGLAALALGLTIALSGVVGHDAAAEQQNSIFGNRNKQKQTTQAKATQGGKAVTETEVLAGSGVESFLTTSSASAMEAALGHYQSIAAAGGWPQVGAIGKMKKGSESKGVAALNQRLFIEGYLRKEAVEGEFASRFTTATEDAVKRFQRNHGLAATGQIDTATQKAMNVPVERRIATIKANMPRIAEYSKDLGDRYIIVNVPAMQIESVEGGKVYSRHNAIVGRPSRPTPVVQTALSTVKFNPYWNAPASIVEKDIIPRMISSGPSRVLNEMNIKVFKGVGGPEIDPDTVNWRKAIADDYHFRQEPGGENAMKTAKIEFPSPFGIYLHDTPEPHLFKQGNRYLSSGCVRVDRVEVLLGWILRGQDGINQSRISELAETQERLDVALEAPPQLRVAYLTAWPAGGNVVAFRNDIYNLDKSGFVVGQPLDVAETSQRFTLKPIPRSPSAVDADEFQGFSFFRFSGSKNREGMNEKWTQGAVDDKKPASATQRKTATGKSTGKSFFQSSSEQAKAKKVADKEREAEKKKVATKKTSKTGTKVASNTTKSKSSAKPEKSAAKKAPAGKSTKPTDTKAKPAAKKDTGAAKDAKKPAAECKADKDGKLPEGCKAAATAKPKAKPAGSTDAAKKPEDVAAAN